MILMVMKMMMMMVSDDDDEDDDDDDDDDGGLIRMLQNCKRKAHLLTRIKQKLNRRKEYMT